MESCDYASVGPIQENKFEERESRGNRGPQRRAELPGRVGIQEGHRRNFYLTEQNVILFDNMYFLSWPSKFNNFVNADKNPDD